jgi:hypothetical protein
MAENICDCCLEQSNCITTCNFNHKICYYCIIKTNKKKCFFCSPYGETIEKNQNQEYYYISNNIIITLYLISIFFISFYIDGVLYIFYEILFNLSPIYNNLIFYYFPNFHYYIIQAFMSIIIIYHSLELIQNQ